MIVLKGITWNHTRGLLPMAATAQRFHELNPGVEIRWEKRSLQEFADAPVDRLAEAFDLLVVDHPFTAFAAARKIFVPLDGHLSPEFLADQAENSVGASHCSYETFGRQWALAIDAAAPVSTWRPDLVRRFEIELPKTWAQLLDLARRGLVAVPAIPIDSMMNFYMMCVALGEDPALAEDRLVDDEIARQALEFLRELLSLCSPECLRRNPIATAEHMTRTDEIAYCPFAYGYSNYSRPGYAQSTLKAGGLVSLRPGGEPLRSTLGGTGLAVSASCRHIEVAMEYAAFVASPQTQRGLYFASGGQPGYRSAWTDQDVNAATNDFFKDTLNTLDRAYLRPRFDGSIPLQDQGGPAIHRYLCGEASLEATVHKLNEIYRKCRTNKPAALAQA